MADSYGLFWNSQNGDRAYNADSFSEWLQKFFTTGVFQNELQVTESSGMVVNVGTGYANINGKVRFFDTASQITLSPASGTYPRIDTIVVERNDTNREITVKSVTGAYSGSDPVPTAPVRTGAVYQIVLAQIYIAAGATAITQADITDTRADGTVCGWVVGTVDSIDLSQLLEQSQQAFEEWFATIQGILDEETAGHLQNEIEALQEDVSDLQGATTIISSTMTVAGWSNGVYSFEADYPVATYDLEIELNGDTATEAQIEAWSGAMILGSALTNSVKAMGDVPTVALPIILKVTRKLA